MNTGRIILASNSMERHELRSALAFEGHQVTVVEIAGLTPSSACSGRYDVLLLDVGMDDIEPYRLCRDIRSGSDLGIIVINRAGGETGSIDALNAGADDYVAVPFVVAELMARVRALLRRVTRASTKSRQIVLHDRAIDFESHEVKGPDGRVCHLTPKEVLVLQHLVTHTSQPRTHQSLAQTVWQRDGSGEVEYMRVVIKQLRRKLEKDPANPRYILTERTVGYRFHMPQPPTHSSQTDNLATVQ